MYNSVYMCVFCMVHSDTCFPVGATKTYYLQPPYHYHTIPHHYTKHNAQGAVMHSMEIRPNSIHINILINPNRLSIHLSVETANLSMVSKWKTTFRLRENGIKVTISHKSDA